MTTADGDARASDAPSEPDRGEGDPADGDGATAAAEVLPTNDDAAEISDAAAAAVAPDTADAAAAYDAPTLVEVTDDRPLTAKLEAILLVADRTLDPATIARAVGRPVGEAVAGLDELRATYADADRGIAVQQVAGGWRFVTHADYADVVERFVVDGAQSKLSQAALETLAVIAYRQPVSRARVSAIRAVNVDGVVRTLTTRGLVEEAGTDPTGTAVLYRTTPLFLEKLGVQSLADLPEVADYLPDLAAVDDAEF